MRSDRHTPTCLAEALRRQCGDDLLWIAAPYLCLRATSGYGGSRWGVERPRSSLLAVAGKTSVSAVAVDASLFVYASHNQRRAMSPCLAGRSALGRSAVPLRRYHGLAARVPVLAEAVAGALEGCDATGNHGFLYRTLLRSARALAQAEAILESRRPAVLVAATQHDASVRAFLLAARRRSIPTAYVPHAPVANNLWYKDLPFDHAGLRGDAEVEFYADLGADRTRLTVVGNAAVRDVLPPPIDITSPPVLAVSPDPVDELAALVATVQAAIPGPVIVAPHPRSDLRLLRRLVPITWSIWRDGPTFDLLKLGPPCVIQHSSGVAWEALALGLPTIDLRLSDDPPNYPLIAEPYVLPANGALELKEALKVARSTASSAADRDRLVGWALHWCSFSGPEAAERLATFVAAASADGSRSPLLDGWAPVK
jgi:hypothetical protein